MYFLACWSVFCFQYLHRYFPCDVQRNTYNDFLFIRTLFSSPINDQLMTYFLVFFELFFLHTNTYIDIWSNWFLVFFVFLCAVWKCIVHVVSARRLGGRYISAWLRFSNKRKNGDLENSGCFCGVKLFHTCEELLFQ